MSMSCCLTCGVSKFECASSISVKWSISCPNEVQIGLKERLYSPVNRTRYGF